MARKFFHSKRGPLTVTIHGPTSFNEETFQVNSRYRTPLHLCTFHPNCPLSAVKLLVDLNPHATVTMDDDNFSPLHYACKFGVRRKKIDLTKISSDGNDSHVLETRLEDERERDELLKFLCKATIETDRKLLLGQYIKFDGKHIPKESHCTVHCCDNESLPLFGTRQVDIAERMDKVLEYSRTSAIHSPLYLACIRNAPLKTICILLDARKSIFCSPIVLSQREHDYLKSIISSDVRRIFPGFWIGLVSGAESWCFSCIKPRRSECSMTDHPNYWAWGYQTPLGFLVNLLESENYFTSRMLGYMIRMQTRERCFNRMAKYDSTTMDFVKMLMQFAFTKFDFDVYLYFAPASSNHNILEERLSLCGIEWVPERFDYSAIISDILPAMELAQKIGYMLKNSAQTPPCMCNLHRAGFIRSEIMNDNCRMCFVGFSTKECKVSDIRSATYSMHRRGDSDSPMHQHASTVGFSPLHAAASLIQTSKFLVEVLMAVFPNHTNIRDEMGFTPLHHILYVSNICSDLHLHERKEYCKSILVLILSQSPDSAKVDFGNGMTTTNFAICCGLEWYDGLAGIVITTGVADALSVPDKFCGLRPFMFAASLDLSLDTIYNLLRYYPVL